MGGKKVRNNQFSKRERSSIFRQVKQSSTQSLNFLDTAYSGIAEQWLGLTILIAFLSGIVYFMHMVLFIIRNIIIADIINIPFLYENINAFAIGFCDLLFISIGFAILYYLYLLPRFLCGISKKWQAILLKTLESSVKVSVKRLKCFLKNIIKTVKIIFLNRHLYFIIITIIVLVYINATLSVYIAYLYLCIQLYLIEFDDTKSYLIDFNNRLIAIFFKILEKVYNPIILLLLIFELFIFICIKFDILAVYLTLNSLKKTVIVLSVFVILLGLSSLLIYKITIEINNIITTANHSLFITSPYLIVKTFNELRLGYKIIIYLWPAVLLGFTAVVLYQDGIKNYPFPTVNNKDTLVRIYSKYNTECIGDISVSDRFIHLGQYSNAELFFVESLNDKVHIDNHPSAVIDCSINGKCKLFVIKTIGGPVVLSEKQNIEFKCKDL